MVWITVVVVAALFGVGNALAAAVLVVRGDWFEAVLAAGFARAGYWFAYGAWVRTPWADRLEVDPVPGPSELTDARLRRYLLGAGLAAVAASLALALQAVDGRWVD